MRVLGIMSGTSCDGVDLCLTTFNGLSSYSIEKALTVEYTDALKSKLQKSHELSGRELIELGNVWSRFVSQEICKNFNLDAVELIASHGHTVFHEPKNRLTYQLGSLDVMASELGIDVVGDFRSFDVASAGQGAPLVPIGDHFLFSEYDVCINFGGIVNATFDVKNENFTAFDIVPCNLVLNELAEKLGKPFDENGSFARSGKISEALFDTLNKNDFFEKCTSKSLGREWVAENVWPVLNKFNISAEDMLSTYVEHVVFQILKTLPKKGSVLLTGGGVNNKYLIQRLKESSEGIHFVVPENNLISFKEAVIFGFLGYLRANQLKNISSFVTGSSKNSCSGHYIKGKLV